MSHCGAAHTPTAHRHASRDMLTIDIQPTAQDLARESRRNAQRKAERLFNNSIEIRALVQLGQADILERCKRRADLARQFLEAGRVPHQIEHGGGAGEGDAVGARGDQQPGVGLQLLFGQPDARDGVAAAEEVVEDVAADFLAVGFRGFFGGLAVEEFALGHEEVLVCVASGLVGQVVHIGCAYDKA